MESSSDQSKYSKRYTPEGMEKVIIELLERNPHGLNTHQLAQQLEINRNTLSKWLKTLEAKNKIISRKMGVSNLYYKTELKNNFYYGPYILKIEKNNGKIIIKQSNNIYLSRINEIQESLIEADLFKFYPFSDYEEEFRNFFKTVFENLNVTTGSYSEKIVLKNSDDKRKVFLFKFAHFPEKENQFTVNFQDLTLLKLAEDQLLNSDSISKILNLFTDSYITIVSNDFKVIMANDKTISDFNDGITIGQEPIYCYDLFNNGQKNWEDCFGKLAMETNMMQEGTIKINNQDYMVKAIPINSAETDMKGYILVLKK